MTFKKPTMDYWNHKFVAYMHDPVDKVFFIPGHETRSGKILSEFGLDLPNDRFWKFADAMASGFERGQVPSFSNNENENGAVDFLKHPVITHPTSKNTQLKLELPDYLLGLKPATAAETVNNAVVKAIEEFIGKTEEQTGYSGKFQGDPELFAKARFFYTHLGLRFKLAEENVAALGGLWHRIPADSRFPDHSIWQHNALTSAFYSCMELSGTPDDTGMMVFSITPVQEFIGRARKLRDSWTGSVILSWLAFEGIKWVCENLGPDHVLYPSLIDQPLMNEYLESCWKMDDINSFNSTRNIASFPNKFLFLVPLGMSHDIADGIKKHIHKEWVKLCTLGEKKLLSVLGMSGPRKNRGNDQSEKQRQMVEHIHEMFQRQAHDFWDLTWSSTKILNKEDLAETEKFLPLKSYEKQLDVLEIFNQMIKDKPHYDKSGRGVLYSVTHSLTQSVLAASKTIKQVTRKEETGEKCHLCGEFEILHADRYTGDIKAVEYKKKVDGFWMNLRDKWGREADFGNNSEKLCSLCLLKRILYRCFESKGWNNGEEHILFKTFDENTLYPSTTEMALHYYFERNGIDNKQRAADAQALHDDPDDSPKGMKLKNRDKYYAILIMDGDRMGRLVNGQTLASTWSSILHPDMYEKLTHRNFSKKYRENWSKLFDQYPQRLLTPSIHAAISESLGDFAIYGVASIVNNHAGKLIYAGGDDVCAVLPVDNVLKAAREISNYYTSTFQVISEQGDICEVKNSWKVSPGKLSTNLGAGDDISISAGVLVCHHKENLSLMMKQAHSLLEEQAKAGAGRNACAVELRKRSGGSRFFTRKWDDPAWESFLSIGKAAGKDVEDIEAVSTSLVYRLEQYRVGVEALLKKEEQTGENSLVKKFIQKQLERSSLSDGMEDEFAEKITGIVTKREEKRVEFIPEGLIVASFICGGDSID